MSIPQPTLDDHDYAELLEEARALIPSLAPQWTNHNPSDPGITLIELFAWLTEMLIYRVNRLPDENTRAFLRLLNEPGWIPGPDLEKDIRDTVLGLRKRHRAITTDDYEALAREASPGVQRAHCVPRRNLAEETEAGRLLPREDHVSVIVLPDPKQAGTVDPASQTGPLLPGSKLLSTVSEYLHPRRLLTVRQHVVQPIYVPIQAEIVVALRADVPAKNFCDHVVEKLAGFLDASTGGPDGQGWPFGRDVHVSELYRLLEKELPGVDHVPDITLASTCLGDAPRCIAGRELWNEDGDLIGIGLSDHHLPWPQIDRARIAVGSAVLPIRVRIEAEAIETFGPAWARRVAKTAIKRLFHPVHGGPGGGSPREVANDEIADEVARQQGIRQVVNVVLETAPERLSVDETRTSVRFKAGEIADVTVTVKA